MKQAFTIFDVFVVISFLLFLLGGIVNHKTKPQERGIISKILIVIGIFASVPMMVFALLSQVLVAVMLVSLIVVMIFYSTHWKRRKEGTSKYETFYGYTEPPIK